MKEAKPDLLIVAWAGTTATAMWRSLIQQGVLDMPGTSVVTGLAERATWPAYGDDGLKIKFFTHYLWKAPKSPVNEWLVKKMRRQEGQVPDLFTPDGFVAAQMLVRAIGKANGDDVEKMISALEGWQFMAPKGLQRIRQQDHAMTQPMFRVKLTKVGGKFGAEVLGRISPGETQPPVVAVPQLGDERNTATDDPTDAMAASAPSFPPRTSGWTSAARRSSPMSRSGCARRVRRDHRSQRGRQDVAVQLALGPLPADGGVDRARRPRHHEPAAIPADAGGGWAGRSRSRACSRA